MQQGFCDKPFRLEFPEFYANKFVKRGIGYEDNQFL